MAAHVVNAVEPQVKGQTLKSMWLYLQASLTGEQLRSVTAALDPAELQTVERPILPTATVPMKLVDKLCAEGARAAGRPLTAFAQEAGRFSAREGVKGVYRLFVRVFTVEALINKAAMMWSSMNTSGTLSARSTGARSCVVTLSDFPSPDPVLCARLSGWFEELVRMSGQSRVTVTHARCTSRGSTACEWDLSW